jgi:hypothetical protein
VPSTVLREHQSVVPGSPIAVYSALLAALTPSDASEINFLADSAERFIVVQGGWWYRGEYRVTTDPAGSRVSFALVNVAPTAHWAGPIAGREVVRNSARDFGALVARIA